MSIWLGRAAVLVFCLLAAPAFAPTASAAAQITVRACATIETWASGIDAQDVYSVAPTLTLPKALHDDRLVPVFGIPALAWARDDLGTAGNALKKCGAEAKKRGDAAAMQALRTALWLLGKALPSVQNAIAKAAADAEKQKVAIDALPDSDDLIRAIGALLAVDPAAPDGNAFRALPRPVVDPMWQLAKDLAWLPDDRRAALFAALAERRAAAQNTLAAALEAAVAATPADAGGMLALMDVRHRLASVGSSDALVATGQSAVRRLTEIRATLLAMEPATWVPPDCTGLYRWSGAEGAGKDIRLGVQGTKQAFADAAVVPVFGLPIADWRDDDVARLKTLRGLCQAEWQALLPSGQRIDAVAPDAPELLRLAGKGHWIDGADAAVTNARAAAQAYRATTAALSAARQEIDALPESVDSLPRLSSLQRIPELAAAGQAERADFERAVVGKREAIMVKALDGARAGLNDIKIAVLGDFAKLYQYAHRAMMTLPDPNGQQTFLLAVDDAAREAFARLQPEFQSALDAVPESLAGLAQAWHAVDALTGVTGARDASVFSGFRTAAFARVRAIAAALRVKNCAALLDELDVDDDDAARPLWDGKQGTTLGAFVCALAESGAAIREFDDGGSPTIKVDLGLMGVHTISLHEADVGPDRSMLAGYRTEVEVEGAEESQKRDVNIEDWAFFVTMRSGGRIVTDSQCEPVRQRPDAELSLEQRMLALDCETQALEDAQ